MDKQTDDSVGFLESNKGRKSTSRLTIMISSFICVFATLIEGCTQVITAVNSETTYAANWRDIAFLTAVLLLGTGGVKAAQSINIAKKN